jgi:hypothetical protein
MSTIRTLAAHDIVRLAYPRPPPEDRDRIAMATGKAIDGALSQFGHLLRRGSHPSQASIAGLASDLLDEALDEAAVTLPPAEKEATMRRIEELLRAYRRSEIAGLTRPKTRVVLIEGQVGVYAQPDYWDGHRRFFEMKSYRAIPPPPDVALQLRLFQLAFPAMEAVLICLDRHASPVRTTAAVVPPPTSDEAEATLRLAYDLGLQHGQPKVIEYMDGPFVRYSLPARAA